MKRVLITGGRGFIGRHALPLLLERDFEVVAVTSSGPQGPSDGVSFVRADLRDPSHAATVVSEVRPTHLLHLAWTTEHGTYWESPQNHAWVDGSIALYKAFADCGGKRAVSAGTCAEYEWGHGKCNEETTPLKPATLYGRSKLKLFEQQNKLFNEAGIPAAWGRIFLCYGPHENPKRFVPNVITSLLKGEEAKCSPGGQLRDFLHAEDVASAFVHMLDGDIQGAVNVASGEPVSLADVARKIAAKIGREDLLKLGALPMPAGDPPSLYGDVKKLSSELGWRPHNTLDAGIEKTINWWRENL